MDKVLDITYYLEDLTRLHTLDIAVLNALSHKYPASPNIHFLKAKKHQMEGLTDDVKVFQDASFYITDHHCLYQRMMHSEVEQIEEEKLPLEATEDRVKDDQNYALADVEELLNKTQVSTETEAQTDFERELLASIAKLKSAEKDIDESAETKDQEINTPGIEEVVELASIKNKPIDIPEPNDIMDLKKDNLSESNQNKEKTDEVLSPFSMWLLSLKAPVANEEISSGTSQVKENADSKTDQTKISKKKKKDKKKKKKKQRQIELEARAKRSVELSEELATEALAELLASQGHFKEAKKMFKKLSLIFPEKSSYFAVRIQSIKKKKNDH